MLSRNLNAASAKRYVYDSSYSFIDVRSMQGAEMCLESDPEKQAFVTLKARESFSLKKELSLRIYDGTKDSKDYLHPGTHYLQLRVATWYYFVDPEIYREKWRDDGYLWSQNVTSVPMRLVVEASQ